MVWWRVLTYGLRADDAGVAVLHGKGQCSRNMFDRRIESFEDCNVCRAIRCASCVVRSTQCKCIQSEHCGLVGFCVDIVRLVGPYESYSS